MPQESVIRFNQPVGVAINIDGFGSSSNGEPPSLGEFSGDDDRIKKIRRKNRLWVEFSPLWKFFQDAYQGGIDFAKADNIFRHARENEQDFKDRVLRLDNMNYCEPIIDFFTNFIFSEAIDRMGGTNKDYYIEFVEDVDKRGSDINAFMREVSDDMQIYGMSYILVDTPKAPAIAVVTKADEKDLGIRPYWILIKPIEIIDWVVDDFGELTYIKRFQQVDKVVDGDVACIERYTEYRQDEIKVTELDATDQTKIKWLGQVVSAPPLPGKIPITVARYKRDKNSPHMGLSFLRDFAFNNRKILNLTSMLDEFLCKQCFNILAKEVEGGVPLREQEDGVIGTSNVMEYPKGAKEPKYITPSSDPAKIIQDERARVKNEMFVRAAQDALTELFNGEKSSGFSQAQSFAKTVPFIANRADILERAEIDLMDLTFEMVSKEWDGKIKYKDRYELTNLSDALVQLQILVRDFAMPSELFVKEQLKRMVREFDGKMPVETLMAVETQIDAMDFKSWMEIQTQALVGAPGGDGSSPGAQQKPKDTMTIRETASEAKVRTSATTKLKE